MQTAQGYQSISEKHILIIGDIMLDEYIYGDVSHISPEAPVPIVKTTGRSAVPGGAANVAAGVAALGAKVTMLGVVGKDVAGSELQNITAKLGIKYDGINSENRNTTVKTRIVGNGHQIVRYDCEMNIAITNHEETELLSRYSELIAKSVDIVVISDYVKGVCTDSLCRKIIEEARRIGKPVIVDTKKVKWNSFSGATIITPNFSEFKTALNMPSLENTESDIIRYAGNLAAKHDISGILVTRSQYGMTYTACDGTYFTVNAAVREVFDVSGAGDTVVAALAVFLALGETVENAMEIANTAAGIAVGKPGTHAVTYDELTSIYTHQKHSKAYSLPELDAALKRWRSNGKKIVFTNGCYDILHSGHVSLLSAAKHEGDILIVGLNSDASVRRLKGEERPICSQEERLAVLAATEAVDAVVIFDEDTPLKLIQKIEPDVLVKGGDYTGETLVGSSEVMASGGRVVIVPLVSGKSSTSIIERVRESKCCAKDN